eukprot:jgi/Chlat1/5501/Chrsp360S05328
MAEDQSWDDFFHEAPAGADSMKAWLGKQSEPVLQQLPPEEQQLEKQGPSLIHSEEADTNDNNDSNNAKQEADHEEDISPQEEDLSLVQGQVFVQDFYANRDAAKDQLISQRGASASRVNNTNGNGNSWSAAFYLTEYNDMMAPADVANQERKNMRRVMKEASRRRVGLDK